ncbi:MAG: hypothetical protein J7M25_18865 [Deltaproteobacteria bacterium]|nr:hypothetical protein [Deltaproteobacteria bacterium]
MGWVMDRPIVEGAKGLGWARQRVRCATVLLFGSLIALLLFASEAEAATVTLQNDSFVSGGSVGCQAGFASGEMSGVTLGPVTNGFRVQNIQFVFGGAQTQVTLTLHVYLDSGGTNPGTELYHGDYQVTGADDSMQQIDVSSQNIVVPAGSSIRVALEVQHNGAPGICRDMDGIHAGRNWIYSSATWYDAQSLGVQGDWVMRAEVDTFATSPDAGVSVDGAVTQDGATADGAVTQDGAMADGAVTQDGATADGAGSSDGSVTGCNSSTDCQGGQVCYEHTCRSVCSKDEDCPGGSRCHHGLCKVTCTASSQCLGGEVCADDLCQQACIESTECEGGEVCRDGVCRKSCASNDECWGGETCQSRVCVAGAPTKSSSGCNCRSTNPPGGALWLLLLGLGLWLRRRVRAF